MRLIQIEIAHQQVVERLHHQRCRKLGRQHIAGNALDTVGGQQGIAGVACQRRALVAGDEDDRCAVLLGGTGGRLQRLAAACAGNEQQGIFWGQCRSERPCLFWHRADHAALAQTAQLERGIHGNGQAAAVGFDLNDFCCPQNGKHLSQLDKVQGLNGGLNLLLTVVLKIEQGLMQRVIGGPFAGLRFLLLQHIPRKLQLEFAVICVAELVAQPGDRGFGRVAGLCKLRRGGDRGPLYICKNAVRNAPFGAVKLEPGAQLGDDTSRGIVHSNTSLCALYIGHNAQYSGNSIPIFW